MCNYHIVRWTYSTSYCNKPIISGKQNKGTPHVRHLQTLIVVGTLLGAICAPIIGDKELLFSVKLLASGTALVFTLSVFKYFIQR